MRDKSKILIAARREGIQRVPEDHDGRLMMGFLSCDKGVHAHFPDGVLLSVISS
jgi:hypothetical protein